jgi:hypothetical protein
MNEQKKYLSVTIQPEKLIGIILKALFKGDTCQISVSENQITTQGSPNYTNPQYGVSAWVKDSVY